MARAEMTGRQRLLTTMQHQEPDRVPISPRYAAWLQAEYGLVPLEREMELLPDLDYMHIAGDATPDYLTRYPDEYDLPDIEMDQVRYAEDCHQEYFKKPGRNAACHIRKKPEN